jgi:hypothetical protein
MFFLFFHLFLFKNHVSLFSMFIIFCSILVLKMIPIIYFHDFLFPISLKSVICTHVLFHEFKIVNKIHILVPFNVMNRSMYL